MLWNSPEADENKVREDHNHPLILPDILNGEGDLDEWISWFEDVTDLNIWSDADKLHWLKVMQA